MLLATPRTTIESMAVELYDLTPEIGPSPQARYWLARAEHQMGHGACKMLIRYGMVRCCMVRYGKLVAF